MWTYSIRRAVGAVPTLFVLCLITFFMMRVAPGGPFSGNRRVSPEFVKLMEDAYHLNDPLLLQFWNWFYGVLHFDLGPSLKLRDYNVSELIAIGLPTSLEVGAWAMILSTIVGLALGIVGALRRNGPIDYSAGAIAMVGVAVPIFVIGPVLMADHYDGARSWAVITALFGIGNIVGDVLLLAWRPAYALRVGALMLIGSSCQAAIIGSHLPVWGIGLLELLTGICVTGMFTLWETSLGEHIPARSLSRVSSYDYLSTTGVIPLGNVLVGGLAAMLGIYPALMVMTVAGISAALVVVSIPSVRHLPRGPHQPATGPA